MHKHQPMVEIISVEVLEGLRLKIEFDDGITKIVDIGARLPDTGLTRPLRDPEFFRQVKVYPGGDGIFWPNDYDNGADMLRYYAEDEIVGKEEVEHPTN